MQRSGTSVQEPEETGCDPPDTNGQAGAHRKRADKTLAKGLQVSCKVTMYQMVDESLRISRFSFPSVIRTASMMR